LEECRAGSDIIIIIINDDDDKHYAPRIVATG
jgi:hypothetical protein